MSASTGWSELLAQVRRPDSVPERKLSMAREEAAGPLSGTMETVIIGAGNALAALAIAHGAAAVRDFPPAIAPVVERIGNRNAMFPDAIADLGILELVSLVAISEAVGASLSLPDFDRGHRFKRFLLNKAMSRTDRMSVALLALHLGRVDDARLIVKASGAEAMPLVKALVAASGPKSRGTNVESAFDAFLRDFPAELSARNTEWRQLMLAAILVIAKHGGTPIAEVADELHRRVEKLAAGESA